MLLALLCTVAIAAATDSGTALASGYPSSSSDHLSQNYLWIATNVDEPTDVYTHAPEMQRKLEEEYQKCQERADKTCDVFEVAGYTYNLNFMIQQKGSGARFLTRLSKVTVVALSGETILSTIPKSLEDLKRQLAEKDSGYQLITQDFEQIQNEGTVCAIKSPKSQFIRKVKELTSTDYEMNGGKYAYAAMKYTSSPSSPDYIPTPPTVFAAKLHDLTTCMVEDNVLTIGAGGYVASGMQKEDVPEMLSEIFDKAVEAGKEEMLRDITKLRAGSRHGRIHLALQEFGLSRDRKSVV